MESNLRTLAEQVLSFLPEWQFNPEKSEQNNEPNASWISLSQKEGKGAFWFQKGKKDQIEVQDIPILKAQYYRPKALKRTDSISFSSNKTPEKIAQEIEKRFLNPNSKNDGYLKQIEEEAKLIEEYNQEEKEKEETIILLENIFNIKRNQYLKNEISFYKNGYGKTKVFSKTNIEFEIRVNSIEQALKIAELLKA